MMRSVSLNHEDSSVVFIAASDENVTTVVPHGASCEDRKDTRALPSWTVWGKPLSGGGCNCV